MKVLKVIGIIVLVIIIFIAMLIMIAGYKNEHYYNYLETEKDLEKKYSKLGDYDVDYTEYNAESNIWQKYEIWYPKDLKENKYPVIIIANGTGVKASSNKAFFKHLASWGFIVVGNEDENSFSGESSSKSLDFILEQNNNKDSIFYNKVDTENIGISGHSQGGVGAINGATNWDNSNMYKAICTVSATSHYIANGFNWNYDESKITIPYFFAAGTGLWDAGTANDINDTENAQGICPLYNMNDIYNSTSSEYKVMGRLVNIDHGQTQSKADAYMTAWFMYWLKNDNEAREIFFEDDAEILTNKNWQDVNKNF